LKKYKGNINPKQLQKMTGLDSKFLGEWYNNYIVPRSKNSEEAASILRDLKGLK
jgi:hypothetical protein